MTSGEQLDGGRPDVDPAPAFGYLQAEGFNLGPHVVTEIRGLFGRCLELDAELATGRQRHSVHGQDQMPRRTEKLPAGFQMGRVRERSSDRVSERLEECERHSPTHEHGVCSCRERAQDSDLVLHLGTAEDHDKRPRRLVEQAGQNLDLTGQQAARR